MRIFTKTTVVIIATLLFIGSCIYRAAVTAAQSQPQQPYLSANQQAGQFPTLVNLSCTGCHGPGKTLPDLHGEKFHKDAHSAQDASIHGGQRPLHRLPHCKRGHDDDIPGGGPAIDRQPREHGTNMR